MECHLFGIGFWREIHGNWIAWSQRRAISENGTWNLLHCPSFVSFTGGGPNTRRRLRKTRKKFKKDDVVSFSRRQRKWVGICVVVSKRLLLKSKVGVGKWSLRVLIEYVHGLGVLSLAGVVWFWRCYACFKGLPDFRLESFCLFISWKELALLTMSIRFVYWQSFSLVPLERSPTAFFDVGLSTLA